MSESLIGQELELDIENVAHGGHFVGRDDGRAVFVRHTAPGERVRARITKGKAGDRFLFADAVEVLSRPSEHRVTPPCPYAGPGKCGGCDFQHIDIAEQRRLKREVVLEQFERLAGLDVSELLAEVQALPGDQDGLRWRTRLELAIDNQGRPGLHPHHSHQVLPIDDCLIATERVIESGVLDRRFPGNRAVDVIASSTGERAIVEVPKGLRNTPSIHEVVSAPDVGFQAEFLLSARGFWQVHPGAAATFVRDVITGLDPAEGDRCLDLYAGLGLFARAIADRVGADGAVLAIESDKRAVAAGERWASELGYAERVEFREGLVQHELEPLLEGGDEVDLIVLDPPRAGAGAGVVQQLTALRPRAIAYVACDPAALARDVASFAERGYEVRRLTAYDAFPMTHHVECIAILAPSGQA